MRGYKYIKDPNGLPHFDSKARLQGDERSRFYPITDLNPEEVKSLCELMREYDYKMFTNSIRFTHKKAKNVPDKQKYPLMKHAYIAQYKHEGKWIFVEVLKTCPKTFLILIDVANTKYVKHSELRWNY